MSHLESIGPFAQRDNTRRNAASPPFLRVSGANCLAPGMRTGVAELEREGAMRRGVSGEERAARGSAQGRRGAARRWASARPSGGPVGRAHTPVAGGQMSYSIGEDVVDRTAITRAALRAPAEAPPLTVHAPVGAVGMESPAVERLLSLRRLRRTDWTLILAVVALSGIGLLMVFSASQALNPTDPTYLLRRQALSAALGLLALVVGARLDYHHWRWLALPGLIMALGLMALTLLIGREVNGAQRWLGGSFGFQPSEPAKLALILFLAYWFWRVGPGIRSIRRGLLPFLGAAGGLATLTLAQRDMGTTVVVVLLAFGMYFTAGARPAHLIALVGLGAAALVALALTVGYRRARIAAFLDPLPPGCREANSYQVCQGLLSLGSGGSLGAGLGASVQKAGYLPFPQTDSIYAVLGGELGLLGCAFVVALLAVVVWRGYRAGRRAPDTFGALFACGIATWLAAQAAINIGSVVAAIPFTGVPLPFISYGGAALVSELAGIGILLNIYAHGAPLRNATLARRGRRDVPAHHNTLDGAAGDVASGPAPQAGMPLATPAHTWTRSEPTSFAQTSGEEHTLL